jgi:hypothetical protein
VSTIWDWRVCRSKCLLKRDYVVPGDEHQSGITRATGTSALCTSLEFVAHSSTTQRDQRAKSERYHGSDITGCLLMYSAVHLFHSIYHSITMDWLWTFAALNEKRFHFVNDVCWYSNCVTSQKFCKSKIQTKYGLRICIWECGLVWMKQCIQEYVLLHKPDILYENTDIRARSK